MKFIVSSAELFSRLQTIGRVINSKNTLPILDCFLFDIQNNLLTITASDSETTLVTWMELVESDANVRFCINAKTIQDSMKEIAEQPLAFDVNTDNMEIRANYQNGHFSIMGQNADEYPNMNAALDEAETLLMPASTLLGGINHCLFATANDDLRPIMTGIYFDVQADNLTFVSSDANQLVRDKVYSVSGNQPASFILPKKPATLLKNLLPKEDGDVTLKFNGRNAVIHMEASKLICRLIEGRYPNYNSVIPQNNPNKITIDRLQFLSALRRVSVFSSQISSLVKLHLQDNQITISAQDIDFSTSAEESLNCQFEGTPMSIGFKSTFLIDILNNIPSEEVVIQLADPSRAGVIIPSEQEENEMLLMLLMPMMLND